MADTRVSRERERARDLALGIRRSIGRVPLRASVSTVLDTDTKAQSLSVSIHESSIRRAKKRIRLVSRLPRGPYHADSLPLGIRYLKR